MKKPILFMSITVILSMAFIPTIVNAAFVPYSKSKGVGNVITESNDIKDNLDTNIKTDITYNKNNEVLYEQNTDFENYIIGVVAAEMPALFEKEALKAQAVAARTYAKRKLENGDTLETLIDNGGQSYISIEQMREKWGENFDEYYKNISNAVKETQGELMVYNGEPILAVFHAISSGKTESAANIWSNDEPYLKSVESPMDFEAENYEFEYSIPENVVISKLQKQKPNLVVAKGGLVNQVQIIEKSDAGYIIKIQIGNELFSGREIREILGLRSSDFNIKQDGENVIFVTKGYGHGAGMSQYGANCLAKEGKNYKEILEYYYTDISFAK